MSIAPTLESFLQRHGVSYERLSVAHSDSLEQVAKTLQVPPFQLARSVVLRVDHTLCMVVLPVSHVLDFAALRPLVRGEPQPVSVDDVGIVFHDCGVGSVPPFGEAYEVRTFYDASLFEPEFMIFEAGEPGSLIRLHRDDLSRLLPPAQVEAFAWPVESLSGLGPATDSIRTRAIRDLAPTSSLADRIEGLYELPLMPGHAAEILELRSNPKASAKDLAGIVERDPSLAAQVLRYARSPFFGYRGQVETLQEAISRVLGFDMVMNLALGLALLRPFKGPPDGPLGLPALWRHATFSAALGQRLGRAMSLERRLKPGIVYLSGLLHNFGYLVFAHLFGPEFFLLNRMSAANPDVPIRQLERQVLCLGQAKEVLCLGHASVGAWLLESWGVPEEVVVAAREHHNPSYDGPHAGYANLVYAVDCLLRAHGIGDADPEPPEEEFWRRLGLDSARAAAEAAELVHHCAGADDLIRRSVA